MASLIEAPVCHQGYIFLHRFQQLREGGQILSRLLNFAEMGMVGIRAKMQIQAYLAGPGPCRDLWRGILFLYVVEL